MPYLLGLFYWGACSVSKLGATSKRKGCKIYRIEWEMHVISSFWLAYPFVSVCTSTHCPFIAPQSSQSFGGFGAVNGQWVLVHTVTKESPKLDITCISHSIRSILMLMLPPIYSHCTRPSKTILTNKASIER